jgi:DNA modification methylase
MKRKNADYMYYQQPLNIKKLIKAVNSQKPVFGSTHQFYKYPARFSPIFAREIIDAFTSKGDAILDPFMGSGTSLIEALLLGRRAIGIDISSLATFVAKAKLTPLNNSELEIISEWLSDFLDIVKLNRRSSSHEKWSSYQKNIPWNIRKAIEIILAEIDRWDNRRIHYFLRCLLLKTAQSALDCRDEIPSFQQFLNILWKNFEVMRQGMEEYTANLYYAYNEKCSNLYSCCRIMCRSAIGLDTDKRIPKEWLPFRLVVTSPPYPGVHVLYHRWQIRGRKETAAPFWVTSQLDGNGSSFYSLGSRHEKNLNTYFKNIVLSFQSIRNLLDKDSLVVQLVAFSDLSWQLDRYLRSMEEAGFQEYVIRAAPDRLWRTVPHRKWYTHLQPKSSSSKEVVLFHKLAF